eukprot:gnl/MRDRNA2_/MRDRNA2_192677_c0_seq1.p1 gnl/MRDRNA2_/MRDRNA2_192677_c0~~gnl/MRDRNA2_/MRDRNA2_192677_c0_seq1.p1  ORF type:complete len:312 (+),score=17.04 gnl/MRDRNA2_/MRDRNA2_192677_c0_seq1:56-991(+)
MLREMVLRVASPSSSPAWTGLLTSFSYSIMGASTKAVGKRLSSYELIFLRSCICVVLGPFTGGVLLPPLTSPHRLVLLGRGLFGFLAVVSYFEAIVRIPLATLTLISRLHPLLGVGLARLILGEPLHSYHMWSLLGGVLGTALLADSTLFTGQSGGTAVGYACGLLAALFTSASLLCVRVLMKKKEHPPAVRAAFHWMNLLGGLICCFSSQRGFLWPTQSEYTWLALTALSMESAQCAVTRLLEKGLAESAMYFFLNVVLNMVWGYLLGDPLPSGRELVGAVIILASTAYSGSSETTRNGNANKTIQTKES